MKRLALLSLLLTAPACTIYLDDPDHDEPGLPDAGYVEQIDARPISPDAQPWLPDAQPPPEFDGGCGPGPGFPDAGPGPGFPDAGPGPGFPDGGPGPGPGPGFPDGGPGPGPGFPDGGPGPGPGFPDGGPGPGFPDAQPYP